MRVTYYTINIFPLIMHLNLLQLVTEMDFMDFVWNFNDQQKVYARKADKRAGRPAIYPSLSPMFLSIRKNRLTNLIESAVTRYESSSSRRFS
jgi:hypothetical protein